MDDRSSSEIRWWNVKPKNMKILLTGVTGYIGKRLLPALINEGHEVVCAVRDQQRFNIDQYAKYPVSVIEVDFLEADSMSSIPEDVDIAFYLIHSMMSSIGSFEELEGTCALNFKNRLSQTAVQQVIYLSGIVNEEQLSEHLRSRKNVEDILGTGNFKLTTLRAGIIVGSGSSSFEIIRDLVEKLPLMITPRWLDTRCQPIGIRNVIQFLTAVVAFEEAYDKSFDIGGPEILSYKEMLLQFAQSRGMKRYIFTVPVMTPKLSSYWLYFVTSTSYKLAVNLVNSMKIEVICRPNQLHKMLGVDLIPYQQAVSMAFDKIEQNEVLSSWTDALSGGVLEEGLSEYMNVPKFGCLNDVRKHPIDNRLDTIDKIFSIGGENGWYAYDFLWELRGTLDKVVGGVGLRRGRKNQNMIAAGETLDFWRVIFASREEGRLLLYAEMKLPGEAWLEFKINDQNLVQTATFRPRGLWGRMYWYSLLPMHHFIFGSMVQRIAKSKIQ